MFQFLGTHQNRLDAKGRVSVPAPFRAQLKGADGTTGLVFRPSHKQACVEVWPSPEFEALAADLPPYDLFSDENDDKAMELYADAFAAEPDKEGRVMLPENFIVHAKLIDSVAFVGKGKKFEIWEPAAAAAYKEAVRSRTLARRAMQPQAAGAA